MFSSTGTRSDSGSGRAEAPHFQADRALFFLEPMMEIDAERALFGEPFDHADIGGRDRGRIGLLEAGRESFAIAIESARALSGGLTSASAALSPSLHERTMAPTSRSSVAASISGAWPPERPMMKCTRTSGPSGKNG